MQGEPRATNDIDFVVEMRPQQATAFAKELGPDFDVDVEALADNLQRGGSWNIYYTKLLTKIDLFAVGCDPFDESEFARRRRIRCDLELPMKDAYSTFLQNLIAR